MRSSYHVARFAVHCRAASGFDLLQDMLKRFQPVGLARRLVPAQPIDAGKAHGEPRLVPGRALQALEGDLEHQPLVGLMHDLAHRTEAVDGIAAHEAVDLDELLIGKAEIGFADRNQHGAVFTLGPDPEGVVGVIRRTLAVAALGKRSSYYSDYTFGVWTKGEDGDVLE